MVESRCGILCNECKFMKEKKCEGCVAIKKPFWGDSCKVKSCCESKSQNHCGECDNFLCDTLKEFSYDKKEGDNGKRIDQCKIWLKE